MEEIQSIKQGAVRIRWIRFMKYQGHAKAGTAFPVYNATGELFP